MILEGPSNILFGQSLNFEFKVDNNHVDYEAFIVGMVLALEMRASKMKAINDFQLVTNQVSRKYQTKEPQFLKYIHKVRSQSTCFTSFEVEHVPLEKNFRAGLIGL